MRDVRHEIATVRNELLALRRELAATRPVEATLQVPTGHAKARRRKRRSERGQGSERQAV
jgi:hypothetical protein